MIHILAWIGAGLGAWIVLGLMVYLPIARRLRRAAARTTSTPRPRPGAGTDRPHHPVVPAGTRATTP